MKGKWGNFMISVQIIRLRKQKNISQAQLAKALCISPSTLGMYEQGRRTPSLDTLVQMAKIFQVSLDYLITGSEFPHSTQQSIPRTPQTCPCDTCFWKACNK